MGRTVFPAGGTVLALLLWSAGGGAMALEAPPSADAQAALPRLLPPARNIAVPPAPPAADDRSAQRVREAMLAEYSHLLLPVGGDTFNQVTVFMTEDGRIDRHYALLRHRQDLRPYGDINPASFGRQWEPLGLAPEQLGTLGITNVITADFPATATAPEGALPAPAAKWMIVRYAWPRRPGEPMGGTPSSPATDALAARAPFTHTQAAEVIDHHLPGALNDRGSSPQGIPWLVLSRSGEVLRSGYLPVASPPAPVNLMAALRAQAPDLPLAEVLPMTLVRQYAVAYAERVIFAWVAPESPMGQR